MNLGLAFLTGVMLTTAFPPVGAWWMALPALLILLFLVERCAHEPRSLLRQVALPFSLSFFAIMLYGLRTVDAYVGPALALAAWLGTTVGMAAFWVMGFALYAYGRQFRYPINLLWFFCIWVTVEVLRSAGPWASTLGVPWTPLIEAPFLPLWARLTGFWGFGLLLLAWIWVLYSALRLLRQQRYGWGLLGFNGALLLLFSLCLGGRLMLPSLGSVPVTHPLRGKSVALLQGNFDQRHKLDPAYFNEMRDYYIDATQTLPASVDLALWPETVVPTFLTEDPVFRLRMAQTLAGRKTQVIFGVPLRDKKNWYYNSAVLCDAAGLKGIYNKTALVPFGEYVPLRRIINPLLHHSAFLQDDYRPGPYTHPIATALGGAGVMICFESTLPQYAAKHQQDAADWLLVLTNDAWFLDSPLAALHLQMSRWRAVEAGLPLFFVGNSGISAVVDAAGRIKELLPLGKRGRIIYHFTE